MSKIVICQPSCYFRAREEGLCAAFPDEGLNPPLCYHAVYSGSDCRHGLTQEKLNELVMKSKVQGLVRSGISPSTAELDLDVVGEEEDW